MFKAKANFFFVSLGMQIAFKIRFQIKYKKKAKFGGNRTAYQK